MCIHRSVLLCVLGYAAVLLLAGCAKDRTNSPPTTQPRAQTPPAPHDLGIADIRNGKQAGTVYISGTPGDEGLKMLYDRGVRTYIDLRLPKQAGPDAGKEARALGMTYVPLPMESDSMTNEQAEQFLTVMRQHENAPVLIGCGSANRAGAMYGLYLGAERSCPVDLALERAKEAGMRNASLADALKKQIEKHQSK